MSSAPPAPSAALGERFLQLTTDIVAAVDFEGRAVSANPAFEELASVEAGDLAARHAADVIAPEDRAALAERWRGLVAGDFASANVAVRLGPSPGSRQWFLLTLAADHEACLVYLMGKAIHEHHEAVERARDMEERFAGAFENSAIGMTITSLAARYIRVNTAFARMVGRAADELVGSPVADVSHPDDRAADAAALQRLLADPKAIVQRENRYVRPDGTTILAAINVSAVTGSDGVPQYLIAQMVDVTHQRTAERALAESERRFRTLATASPAGIFSAGFDGRILYANDRLAEIFGLAGSELVGLRWLERVDGSWREPLELAVGSVAEGLGPMAMEVRLTERAGARWARVNMAAMLDGDAGVVFVGTVEDVTAGVEARAELAARETEYRVMAEHSGDFLSRHDPDGRYLYASPASTAVLGYRPEELLGRTVWQLGVVHPDDHEAVRDGRGGARQRRDRDDRLARGAPRRLRRLGGDRAASRAGAERRVAAVRRGPPRHLGSKGR